jgi:cyclic pyranopterin phosphate synthase
MNAPDGNPKRSLIDAQHRKITYLRVSLTSRCNFRCLYCYGSPDVRCRPTPTLKPEHLSRLIRAFAQLGVKKVRFTGGEPLTHPDIVKIVKDTSSIENISRVAVTTNGFMLGSLLPALTDAGLNGLNVSLDSLQRDNFRKITGIDAFDKVYGGIKKAVASDSFPLVKINMVVIRGVNDHEIPDFGRLALEMPVDVRFIEFMPTERSGWGANRLVNETEIKRHLGNSLIPISNDDPHAGPARSYTFPDAPGKISFISAVSRSFCRGCNRIRLTADGSIVGCLFGKAKVDLNSMLVENPSDEEIRNSIRRILASPGFRRKPTTRSVTCAQPSMRRIGG